MGLFDIFKKAPDKEEKALSTPTHKSNDLIENADATYIRSLPISDRKM